MAAQYLRPQLNSNTRFSLKNEMKSPCKSRKLLLIESHEV